MDISTVIGIIGGSIGILGALTVASAYVFGSRSKETITSQNLYITSLEKERDQYQKERDVCQKESHEKDGIIKALRGDVVRSIVQEVKKVKKVVKEEVKQSGK